MDVGVGRSTVAGRARAPASKSYTHRAILAGGYAETARIANPLLSADTRATVRAVEAFGGAVEEREAALAIEGFAGRPGVPPDVIDCENSGTTMRLVTGASSLVDGITVLTGDASLRSRPQGPLLEAIEALGASARSTRGNGQAPLVIEGPVEGGAIAMPGNVSSQFVTALLMAGALTDDGIDIRLETELKSAPYVTITREVLAAFGVETDQTDAGFAVVGGQSYWAPNPYEVPGDFSSMSYLLAAGALAGAGELVVEGAKPSAQGDQAIVSILDEMGAAIEWDRDRGEITVRRSTLEGTVVDVGATPDLLPTIAVLGAAGEGQTRIVNAAHVRHKETDRVAAMAEALTALGATVTEREDELVVDGDRSSLTGETVDGRGDHRIIMALAIAGLVADGVTTITGAEHVDVSFPGFFDVLAELGARIER